MNSAPSQFCFSYTEGRSDIFTGVVSVDRFLESYRVPEMHKDVAVGGTGVVSPNGLAEDRQDSDSSRDVTIEDGGPRTSTIPCEADRCQANTSCLHIPVLCFINPVRPKICALLTMI